MTKQTVSKYIIAFPTFHCYKHLFVLKMNFRFISEFFEGSKVRFNDFSMRSFRLRSTVLVKDTEINPVYFWKKKRFRIPVR